MSSALSGNFKGIVLSSLNHKEALPTLLSGTIWISSSPLFFKLWSKIPAMCPRSMWLSIPWPQRDLVICFQILVLQYNFIKISFIFSYVDMSVYVVWGGGGVYVHMSVSAHRSQKKYWIPWNWRYSWLWWEWRWWESNSWPLQGLYVLLAIEPSLCFPSHMILKYNISGQAPRACPP